MSREWKIVPLGEVIRQRKESIEIDDIQTYKRARVQLHAKGIVLRDIVEGSLVKTKRQQVSRAGEFLVAEIDAKVGGFGMVPDELDGAIVSSHYFLFQIDETKLERRFLDFYIRTPSFRDQVEAQGSTNYAAIRPAHVLGYQIPLPPLAEQRRIVARIEALAAQIDEARRLRKEAVAEAGALYESVLSAFCSGKVPLASKEIESAQSLLERISTMKFDGKVRARRRSPLKLPDPPELPDNWMVVEAGELQEKGLIFDIQDGNHGGDYPRKSEFSTDGVPFVTAKQFSNGVLRINDAPRLPEERAARLRIGFAKANDVFLTHNASVGDVALAPSDAGDFLLGTSATYWRCNPEGLERRYLFYFMLSDLFQGQLRFIMKQTTRNQVSVLKQVSLWICLPPLELQRRIVADLDGLQSEVEALKRLQSETAAELAALLPAILDRAFKGEL